MIKCCVEWFPGKGELGKFRCIWMCTISPPWMATRTGLGLVFITPVFKVWIPIFVYFLGILFDSVLLLLKLKGLIFNAFPVRYCVDFYLFIWWKFDLFNLNFVLWFWVLFGTKVLICSTDLIIIAKKRRKIWMLCLVGEKQRRKDSREIFWAYVFGCSCIVSQILNWVSISY